MKTNRPIDCCESFLPFEGISKFPARCSTRFFLRLDSKRIIIFSTDLFPSIGKLSTFIYFFPFKKEKKNYRYLHQREDNVPRQRIWLSEPTHVIEREGFVARCCRYAAAGYRNISLASPSCVGHWPLGVSECLNTDYRIVPFTRVSARLHVRLQLSYDFPYNHRKGIFLASKFLSLNRSTSFPR